MKRVGIIPNPDLSVGADNKQRWNQPKYRRHGFHNVHKLFRRTMMVRSRNVLTLDSVIDQNRLHVPSLDELVKNPAFSAFVCLQGTSVLIEECAPDFDVNRPHSIQSITKLHIHLIIGRLVGQGLVKLENTVDRYLPDIGSGYAKARIQDLLDMNVENDFSEDYQDPLSDCYNEEIALGWRLSEGDTPEISLRSFTHGITGGELANRTGYADYKSANTDVLTLLAATVSPTSLAVQIEAIADAVGYEGGFHISLSPEHLPAFSGGGCLSARDLARFGLLFARNGQSIHGIPFANPDFLNSTLSRSAPSLTPPKDWLKYSNHVMTDGRFLGHAGYGGQFLLVDMKHGTSCAYLSVLENEAGYDDNYMASVVSALREVCIAASA